VWSSPRAGGGGWGSWQHKPFRGHVEERGEQLVSQLGSGGKPAGGCTYPLLVGVSSVANRVRQGNSWNDLAQKKCEEEEGRDTRRGGTTRVNLRKTGFGIGKKWGDPRAGQQSTLYARPGFDSPWSQLEKRGGGFGGGEGRQKKKKKGGLDVPPHREKKRERARATVVVRRPVKITGGEMGGRTVRATAKNSRTETFTWGNIAGEGGGVRRRRAGWLKGGGVIRCRTACIRKLSRAVVRLSHFHPT